MGVISLNDGELPRLSLNESVDAANSRILLDAASIKRSKIHPFYFHLKHDNSVDFDNKITGKLIN